MGHNVGIDSLDDAIDAYLSHAKLEKGLARNTLQAYARDLSRFAAPLDGFKASRLGREQIRSFIADLEREGLSPASRARALVSDSVISKVQPSHISKVLRLS